MDNCWYSTKMKRSRLHLTLSYLLLFYFIGFVVPPVSAILPSAFLSRPAEDRLAPYKPCNQNNLMLIDLAIWEILNRAKRNDELLDKYATIQKDSTGATAPEGYTIASGIIQAPQFLEDITRGTLAIPVHSSNNPRFSHSGLSPPLV